MMSKLLKKINSINKLVLKVMKRGICFSCAICGLAIAILITYIFVNTKIDIYYLGIKLLKFGAIILVEFIGIGLAFDKIYKELGN